MSVSTRSRPLDSHTTTHSRWPAYLLYVTLLVVAGVAGVPFMAAGQLDWSALRVPLLVGTSALVAATFVQMRVMGFPARDRLGFFVLVFVISWAAEYSGIRWGHPFGQRYRYHAAVAPMLPGNVPLFVPLAWFVLAAAPLALLRGLPLPSNSRRRGLRRLVLTAGLCALFLPGWDLLLEPLSVSAGLWTWEQGGACFGAPFQNFVGWFLVGFAAYLAYFGVVSSHEPAFAAPRRAFELTWLGGGVAFLGLACLAAWRRLDDPTPAVLSCAVVAPYLGFGLIGVLRDAAARRGGRVRRTGGGDPVGIGQE